MGKKEIKSTGDIKQSKWRDLLLKIAKRELSLVVGDDLVSVDGESLNKFLSRKLFFHTLELLKNNIYEGDKENFEKWMDEEYNINSQSEIKDYFSPEILQLYDEYDETGGYEDLGNETRIELFIKKEIGSIPQRDIDLSIFRNLLNETAPTIIVSTSYCSILLNEFLNYASQNSLRPYVGDVLGGVSSGGFRIFGREKDDQGKIIWKEGNVWEGKKGEVIYLTIGGDFNKDKNSVYNLCCSEDDWVRKICKWIVSVQSQGNNTLINRMSESYLLVLGTSIPSWAFRFLWYTLRNPTTDPEGRKGMGNSLAARPEPHNPNVRRFITSYNAMIINATETFEFTNTLISRWQRSPDYSRFKDSNTSPEPDNEHVFVSYMTENRGELEEYLIPILRKLETRNGYKFWYDRRALKGGDEWDFKIKEAIQNAQCFIPFLTKECLDLNDSDEPRYVRIEWRKALERSKELKEKYKGHGIPKFILPITLGGLKNLTGHFKPFESFEITDTNSEDKILSAIEEIISMYRCYLK